MAKQLITTVHVHGHGVFGPAEKLPAEVRKLLAGNPRVWSDEDDGVDEVAGSRPGPSETADRGDAVQAAIEEGQQAREAEHAAAVEAAGLSDDEQPARRRAQRRQ